MIHIALCFHDSDGLYYRKAATTMVSVFENTNSSVHIHIVHDATLSSNKQTEIRNITKQYNQDITFYTAPDINTKLIPNIPARFGRGSLYRFFLHNLINVDKIIYLDCDIICELDIRELYEHIIDDLAIGVVQDASLDPAYAKQLNIPKEKYFNSGVLLLNLNWLRMYDNEMLGFMVETLASNASLRYPDQDILNMFFYKKNSDVLYLDQKFNYTLGFSGREIQDFQNYKNKILHMLSQKPWIYFSNSAVFYWKYYNRTPWGNNVFEDMLKTRQMQEIFLCRSILSLSPREQAWIRRYHDCKALGFIGYIKKRLFRKSARKK